ncbi:hypothetical protein F0U62_00065 [Cystobacter fuscus]|uniref:hypothetical protein n=1 Tax=Cystobacter fuscus TaxID=43 RepID=UPI002B291DD0|nr:hypothetical protein F0U62_00065 [Cystobacter fuscus]
MNSSTPSPTGLKPAVPMLELLLRVREDMETRPVGPYRYIGMPDVDWVNCFKGGYRECLGVLGVDEGSDVLFGVWLRDVKLAWPGEGWEPAYLRECGGDQTRALRKYLDYVAEFRTLSPEDLSAISWRIPEDVQYATRAPQLMPTRAPQPTLDFLMEVRREIGDTEGRLGMFIGPITVRRMEGLIAGYRLCLGLVGARDEEYVRFERWLQDEKGVPAGQEWAQPFLTACQGDHEQAIRRLLGFAAEFRAA